MQQDLPKRLQGSMKDMKEDEGRRQGERDGIFHTDYKFGFEPRSPGKVYPKLGAGLELVY